MSDKNEVMELADAVSRLNGRVAALEAVCTLLFRLSANDDPIIRKEMSNQLTRIVVCFKRDSIADQAAAHTIETIIKELLRKS